MCDRIFVSMYSLRLGVEMCCMNVSVCTGVCVFMGVRLSVGVLDERVSVYLCVCVCMGVRM